MPQLCEKTAFAFIKHVNRKLLTPILAEKKFISLLSERFGMTPFEIKIFEQYMMRTDFLKLSKASFEANGHKTEVKVKVVGEEVSQMKITPL